ncbi:SDR family NAD(P)-dependent oxidoreductase [uncultured Porticoccus sp.]|uniref:SDR family NAD(P)-dependent oxidoreductase n=1 Tax=uncultured Porticoccus sp. TaxID=1256050 RepID=UPI00261AAB78|nr:SDR family NAD(P)-dependent oxidoreductase [uncultured Porticoccus sp.]
MSSKALVIGASSGIAQRLICRLSGDPRIARIYAVSRSPAEVGLSARVNWLTCDYSEADIAETVALLNDEPGEFSRVFICNGMLHEGDRVRPEKRLEEIDLSSVEAVFRTNTFTPLLWLKHLVGPLRGEQVCTLALFSARVGSISDNKLGGWYSYRASKAALNMLVQTASIEYARRAKNVQLVAFHPGTTDTALSRPFQGNVPTGKLFSADFVAEQLLSIVENMTPVGHALYLDWQGREIPW